MTFRVARTQDAPTSVSPANNSVSTISEALPWAAAVRAAALRWCRREADVAVRRAVVAADLRDAAAEVEVDLER